VGHDETGRIARQRTTAAGSGVHGHSIPRFRRLSPFPFAGLPVVAGDTALDHFVAPLVACDDEGGEVAAAEAKSAESDHDDELQTFTHGVVSTICQSKKRLAVSRNESSSFTLSPLSD
jgi:hypothetical protein